MPGENVRYPKNWELKMLPILEKQYPEYDNVELHQVLGGIWNSYGIETKIKIVNEYQDDGKLRIVFDEENKVLGKMR